MSTIKMFLTGLLPGHAVLPWGRTPAREGGVKGSYPKNGHFPFREAPPGRAGRLHIILKNTAGSGALKRVVF
jgi:hypothetical protein